MTKRVALYVRVSTDSQTIENQLLELRAAGARLGWNIIAEFADEGISGAKGRDQRPAYDALLKGVARREFDLVASWAVDRLGRSLRDLVAFLDELQDRNIDLFLMQQGLDTSTPAGRALFGMLSVFSDFERSMITARVKTGIARYVAGGGRMGRAPANPAMIERAKRLLLGGGGIRATARTLKVSPALIQKVKNQMVTDGEFHPVQ